MVHSWHGANGAPLCEGLVINLHHQGEALGRQLAPAGEETLAGQVKFDLEGE